MLLGSRSLECFVLTCYIREKSKNIRSMSFVISLIQSSEKIIFYVKKSFTSWTNWLHRSVPSSRSILIPSQPVISASLSKNLQNSQKVPKKKFEKSALFRKIYESMPTKFRGNPDNFQNSGRFRIKKIENRFFSGALREGSC